MDRVGQALVVDDDEILAATLEGFVSDRASIVYRVGTAAEASRILGAATIDVLLLDIGLPDGSGTDVLATAAAQPHFPRVIAISGSADPTTTFHLAEAGVRSFVSKPLDLASLQRAWDRALFLAPDLRPLIRSSVGQRKLPELEDQVRSEFVDQALAACHGSRHKASALLGISRQLLQRILRSRR